MERYHGNGNGPSRPGISRKKKKKLYLTLAVESADLIALNAANEAVPPPINKYCTLSGID